MSHPIVVRDLWFARGDRPIFEGVNLTIQPGKITAIMGPSGSGKTTLLRLICAQLMPDQGTVHVHDKEVHRLSRKLLYQLRQQMGVLFQSGALFTDLSVFENVAFPLRKHTRLPEAMIQDLVLLRLESVGLRGAQALMPSELSGGMARRVALARALALDPQIMFYDEPFAGQDPITMGVLLALIRRLNKALGMTSVIVSHDVAETAHIADFIYLLAQGKVVGAGTPEEMMHSDVPDVHQFMQGLPDGAVPFHYPRPPLSEDLGL